MVITVEIRKMYKYPFEVVVNIHLNKYPTPLEEHVTGIKTVEEKTDNISGIIYRRKIATCNNVIPKFLRKINFLNVNDVHIEEESWLDMKQRILNIKSRCLTWAQYSTFHEVSVFKQSVENPNWTEFHQKGSIVVTGAGKLNRLCEVFAQAFFNKGVKKSVNIMETILEQRCGRPFL